jgi:hypothetical protein
VRDLWGPHAWEGDGVCDSENVPPAASTAGASKCGLGKVGTARPCKPRRVLTRVACARACADAAENGSAHASPRKQSPRAGGASDDAFTCGAPNSRCIAECSLHISSRLLRRCLRAGASPRAALTPRSIDLGNAGETTQAQSPACASGVAARLREASTTPTGGAFGSPSEAGTCARSTPSAAPTPSSATPVYELRRATSRSPADELGAASTPASVAAHSSVIGSPEPLDLSPAEAAPAGGSPAAATPMHAVAAPGARSPASQTPPLTVLLPRGARLMRMGLTGRDTSQPSPPKAERSRARDSDDDDDWTRVACIAALCVALLLAAAAAARGGLLPRMLRRSHATAATGTGLVVYDAAVATAVAAAADEAYRIAAASGHALFLPFLPHPGSVPFTAPASAPARMALPAGAASAGAGAAQGTALMPRLPALPPAVAAHAPGELALATVAAAGSALALAAGACGAAGAAMTQLAVFAGHEAAATHDPRHAALLAAALGAAVMLLLTRAFAKRAATHARVSFAPTPAAPQLHPGLFTPVSNIGEYDGGETSYGEADSDDRAAAGAAAADDDDDDPLVYTPAITRLLSFSCAASPSGSMHTTLANAYGSALRVRGIRASLVCGSQMQSAGERVCTDWLHHRIASRRWR